MDGNDTLPGENKIPLGHSRTNGAVYSKMNFNVEICSALRYSIVIPHFIPALILLNPNNHYNHGFPNTFD